MLNKGILRIGTSGIVVPGTKQTRPEEFKHISRLTYYNSYFNTLEVNSTFKKISRESTLERWSSEVSSEFQYTIKLWKEITHVKKLKVNGENVKSFLSAVSCIGHKKGCLLIQFPASMTSEYTGEVQHI